MHTFYPLKNISFFSVLEHVPTRQTAWVYFSAPRPILGYCHRKVPHFSMPGLLPNVIFSFENLGLLFSPPPQMHRKVRKTRQPRTLPGGDSTPTTSNTVNPAPLQCLSEKGFDSGGAPSSRCRVPTNPPRPLQCLRKTNSSRSHFALKCTHPR